MDFFEFVEKYNSICEANMRINAAGMLDDSSCPFAKKIRENVLLPKEFTCADFVLMFPEEAVKIVQEYFVQRQSENKIIAFRRAEE